MTHAEIVARIETILAAVQAGSREARRTARADVAALLEPLSVRAALDVNRAFGYEVPVRGRRVTVLQVIVENVVGWAVTSMVLSDPRNLR